MKITSFFAAGMLAGALMLGFGCKSSTAGGPMVPGPNADEMRSMAAIPPDANANGNGSGSGIGGNNGQNGNLVPGGGENLGNNGAWEKIPGLHLGTIYFAFDSDAIRESERGKLEEAADYMKKNTAVGMIIEGHCDERGSAEYNRALGERRALAIRAYLVNLGVPDTHFQTISYGFERPAVQGHNEEAWAKNRRGELDGAKMK